MLGMELMFVAIVQDAVNATENIAIWSTMTLLSRNRTAKLRQPSSNDFMHTTVTQRLPSNPASASLKRWQRNYRSRTLGWRSTVVTRNRGSLQETGINERPSNLKLTTVTGETTEYKSMTANIILKSLDCSHIVPMDHVRSIPKLPIAQSCSAKKEDIKTRSI